MDSGLRTVPWAYCRSGRTWHYIPRQQLNLTAEVFVVLLLIFFTFLSAEVRLVHVVIIPIYTVYQTHGFNPCASRIARGPKMVENRAVEIQLLS